MKEIKDIEEIGNNLFLINNDVRIYAPNINTAIDRYRLKNQQSRQQSDNQSENKLKK